MLLGFLARVTFVVTLLDVSAQLHQAVGEYIM